MPGRSPRGRGGGRTPGGRGRGGRGLKNSKKPDTREYKFYPQRTGPGSPGHTYETVKDYIIRQIQRTFQYGYDVAESIEALTDKDMNAVAPVRDTSAKTNADERKLEQDAMDMKYQAELDEWVRRKGIYKANTIKAYSLIYDTCSLSMQNRVNEHPDFDTTIKNNPVELLKAIKLLMHDPVRARYAYASLTDTIERLMQTKQQENEHLLEYTKRFKQMRDLAKQQMGRDVLHTFVTNTKEYKDTADASKQKAIKEESFESWMTYIYLKNADQKKYGSVLRGMINQYSLGNNQYPSKISAAVDVLANHRFDSRPQGQNQRTDRNNEKDKKKKEDDKEEGQNFAQFCYCCGDKGHKLPKCPKKSDTPREEWLINKMGKNIEASNAQKEGLKNDEKANDPQDKSPKSGWSGLQTCLMGNEEENTKDWIILDSGSTMSLFYNPELVEDIRDANKEIAISTNAGVQITKNIATVPEFGDVWFDKNAIANIFSLAELSKRHKVTYDSEREDAFIVHTENGAVKFKKSKKGLYYYEPSDNYKKSVKHINNMITTVSENEKHYTSRQVERVKTARTLYHNVGAPTVENFKHLIRMNAIRNCPVTVEDVNLAEQIYGPDISALKGKSTRT